MIPIAVTAPATNTDGMTADWYRMPYDVLDRMSNRIINEVRCITRVVYAISSRTPTTTEWVGPRLIGLRLGIVRMALTLTACMDRQPLKVPPTGRSRRPWYQRLVGRLTSICALVGLALVFSGMTLMTSIAQHEARELSLAGMRRSGETVVAQIEQLLYQERQRCEGLATVAAQLQGDADAIRALVPSLLVDGAVGHLVAGGGIWPEPGRFWPGQERASFFWGREPDGNLTFYDDYNDPDGPGYHNEAWYVPAMHMPDRPYWSRSYVDPYSNEPMVTCTVAYRDQDGVVAGAATVDLRLDALRDVMKRHSDDVGGYIMALDRANVFLAHPDPSAVREERLVAGEAPAISYLTIGEFAQRHAGLAALATLMNDDMRAHMAQAPPSQLITALDEGSYQIDADYARLLVAEASGAVDNHPVELIALDDDPLLGQRALAMMICVPEIAWRVVVVVPEQELTAASDRLSSVMAWWSGGLLVSVIVLLGLILHALVTRPIARLTRAIDSDAADPLPDSVLQRGDEIGELARRFEQRSTQLAEAARAARAAGEAKSQFLANMSHEIRTPMNGMLGAARLLDETKLDDEQREQLDTVTDSCQALLTVVNDILDLSKIESGTYQIIARAFDPSALFRTTAGLMEPVATKSGLDFSVTIAETLPADLVGDEDRIRQIILNLLSNACKFTESGVVRLEVDADVIGEQCDLVIAVTDSGIGIPPDRLEEVFGAFAQVEGDDRRRFGGTGLGLSISRHLCRLMGGELSVSSDVGVGSTFTARLPLPLSRSTVQRRSQRVRLQDWAFTGRVLVVEDNVVNQRVITAMLDRLGFSVQVAEHGQEALDRCAEETFDVVFMDMQMPVMDGLEAAQRLRADGLVADTTPIIAFTANVHEGVEEICARAGMHQYVSKPVSPERLVEVLQTVLQPVKVPPPTPS